jgi:glycerol kinase
MAVAPCRAGARDRNECSMSKRYVMALDEGSTSARTVLVDENGVIVAEARNPVVPLFPRTSWVELDPMSLWKAQRDSMQAAMTKVGATTDDIAAIGITTHRESAMIWARKTSKPVHNMIMWMSKQTDDIINRWKAAGLEKEVRARTGLFNDSYFSSGKLAWLVENVPGVKARAEKGELAAGTVDTWLLWNLTGGRSHMTDHSEASRTAMFNIITRNWDEMLCEACGVPMALLPPALPSQSSFGEMRPEDVGLPGKSSVPIMAIMADQQSGMFGQACFEPGSVKNTYGTAGVLTANTGDKPFVLPGLTASIGWTLGEKSEYEAEGVVFHCGQTMQWLRDNLGVFQDGDNIEAIARSVPDNGGVYIVPAFAGICAPHWVRDAKAGIVGLTLETNKAHVVRAGVEAMAYQTMDNVEALRDGGLPITALKVDGGATRNNLLCQFQADILGIPVLRPVELERTALGVAHMAGMCVGKWKKQDLSDTWKVDRVFEPIMSADQRGALRSGWQQAIRTITQKH